MDTSIDRWSYGANDTPTIQTLQRQLSELQSTEDNLRYKQQELQRQVQQIDKDIDATHDAVTKKQAELNERENFLRPIIALPAEILSLIFLNVVGLVQGYSQATPRPMPLVLSSVCRRWRSVVLGDPKLWTHITLEHCNRYNLEPYLSRSGDSRLDISFSGKWYPRTETLIRQLGKETHRWQRLQMDVTKASKGLLPLSSQKRAKSLAYIHLVNKNGHHLAVVFPDFAIHQNELLTVTLIHVPIFKALVAPRLQHLTFIGSWEDDCPADRLWRILSSTTNLRTLHLGADFIDFGEDGTPRHTCLLPHLEHLALYFDEDPDTEQLVDLFDLLAAPSLQVIQFTAVNNLSIRNWDLVPPINQKYPSVTTAIMYNVISHTKEVRWFIKSFPHITNLTIDMTGLVSCSIALGELDPSTNVDCWEMLESIQVRVPRVLSDADGMENVCDWLERRQKLGFPPLRLELVMDQDPKGVDRWEWLDPLGQWSVLTVVKPSEDPDAPWNFLAEYKGQGN